MELASMVAGERFTDRPRSVCPILGALMRAYNDAIDDRRRQDLYEYVSGAVGTRGGHGLQLRRATSAIEWAASRRNARRRRWWQPDRDAWTPELDDGPESIARHVIGSIHRNTDATHAAVLALFDLLIAMTCDWREPSAPREASAPVTTGCREARGSPSRNWPRGHPAWRGRAARLAAAGT
jgi:hypothetical protein